ncbi:MAG: inorganic diphosphatase [Polyangiaceae bacterium]|nr:inorganic diphosphatase [Polyangiaceae bacterium]
MPRSPYDKLPARTSAGHFNVVVETPAGSQNKYKYDPKLGVFRLNRVLFSGASFPFDFGFVAGTRGGDGDPLDALVLAPAPMFPGCLVRARVLGVLLAKKAGKENHRVITTPVVAKRLQAVRGIEDLPVGRLAEIEQFFRAILNVDGQEHALLGFGGRDEAEAIITRAAAALTKSRRAAVRSAPKRAPS